MYIYICICRKYIPVIHMYVYIDTQKMFIQQINSYLFHSSPHGLWKKKTWNVCIQSIPLLGDVDVECTKTYLRNARRGTKFHFGDKRWKSEIRFLHWTNPLWFPVLSRVRRIQICQSSSTQWCLGSRSWSVNKSRRFMTGRSWQVTPTRWCHLLQAHGGDMH